MTRLSPARQRVLEAMPVTVDWVRDPAWQGLKARGRPLWGWRSHGWNETAFNAAVDRGLIEVKIAGKPHSPQVATITLTPAGREALEADRQKGVP